MANDKLKAFDAAGLAAVAAAIKQAQSTGDNAASDLTTLANMVSDILTEIGGAIEQLDANKAYIAVSKDFTLAANSWINDSAGSAQYPYEYELTLSGVSSDVRADVVFDHTSAYHAGSCGMSAISSTAENKVILRSNKQPEQALTGTVYLTRGKVSTSNEEE